MLDMLITPAFILFGVFVVCFIYMDIRKKNGAPTVKNQAVKSLDQKQSKAGKLCAVRRVVLTSRYT